LDNFEEFWRAARHDWEILELNDNNEKGEMVFNERVQFCFELEMRNLNCF
jgi:hypothetical protein